METLKYKVEAAVKRHSSFIRPLYSKCRHDICIVSLTLSVIISSHYPSNYTVGFAVDDLQQTFPSVHKRSSKI